MAVSVAEQPPGPNDCSITSYIKITASITGEMNPLDAPEPGDPSSEYWGCYAATLRVAVHPGVAPPRRIKDKTQVVEGPVIADFEPKLRDLYEAATLQSSLVSGSSSSVTVSRNTKSTSTTALSLSGTVSYNGGGSGSGGGGSGSGGRSGGGSGSTPSSTTPSTGSGGSGGSSAGATAGGGGAGGFGASVTGSISGTTGQEVDFGQAGTTTGTSTATTGMTTSISQMYNLATGYHSGTNSIALVLQSRPHLEQSPFGPLGNFTPGLRAIEGIQEMVLVVSRPNNEANASMTITLWMDLVHISPLTAQPADSPVSETRLLVDPAPGVAPGTPFLLKFDTEALHSDLSSRDDRPPRPVPGDVAQYVQFYDLAQLRAADGTPVLPPGMVIDMDAGDGADHPGVTLWESFTSRHDQDRVGLDEFGAVSPTMVRVAITQAAALGSLEGTLSAAKSFAVWVRPLVPDTPRPTVSGNLHQNQWKLCTAYRLDPITHCPTVVTPAGGASLPPGAAGERISSKPIAVLPATLDLEGAATVGTLLRTQLGEIIGVGAPIT